MLRFSELVLPTDFASDLEESYRWYTFRYSLERSDGEGCERGRGGPGVIVACATAIDFDNNRLIASFSASARQSLYTCISLLTLI
jgi:hypothetical protein